MKLSALYSPKLMLLSVLCSAAFHPLARAVPGDVDLAFDPGSGVNGTVHAASVQADGKVVIGGQFSTVRGLARTNLARLNADGSGDSAFVPGISLQHAVRAVVAQPNGKLLIGYDQELYGIARLNPNGSADSQFNANAYAAIASAQPFFWYKVSSIVLQPDERVVLAGGEKILRLNSDGTLDSAFDAKVLGSVSATALQTDGKLLIAGYLTDPAQNTAFFGVARLLPNGAIDASFDSTASSGSAINAIAVQPDGRVLLAGGFFLTSNHPSTPIIRLNANGTEDSSFNAGLGSVDQVAIHCMLLQADGKLVIGGQFGSIAGQPRINLARLNQDGSVDPDFQNGSGGASGESIAYSGASVRAMARNADGKLCIAGEFSKVDGVRRDRIARLETNGALDATFDPGSSVDSASSILVQPDGKVLFTGRPSAFPKGVGRLNADGSRDSGFDPGSGTNSDVVSVALQSDGKVVIGGSFTAVDGSDRAAIARLYPDGSLVSTFNPSLALIVPRDPVPPPYGGETSTAVTEVSIQSDGKIVVAGYHAALVTGEEVFLDSVRYFVVRLLESGQVDPVFVPLVGGVMYGGGYYYYAWNSYPPSALALQADGKIIVSGLLEVSSDPDRKGIIRLNGDGSPDIAYSAGIGMYAQVTAISLQPDGKALLGGSLGVINGVLRSGIARLHPNGVADSAFIPAIGQTGVSAFTLQPDGRLLIAGSFTLNGLGANIARFNGNGSLDQSYRISEAPGIRSIALQNDGSALIAGDFLMVNRVLRPRIARLLNDASGPANLLPSVSINSPAGGTSLVAPADVVIAVNASHPDGSILRVDFYAGAMLIGSDASVPYKAVWSQVNEGSYLLTADAIDNIGAITTSAAVDIVITNDAPLVSITSPADGVILDSPAIVSVLIDASDSDGAITRVDLYDGEVFIGSDSEPPYEVIWSQPSGGGHWLTAFAYDNAGKFGNSAVANVNIATPQPPFPPTDLTATSSTRKKAKLSWIDNSTDEQGFRVERAAKGKPFKVIATLGSDVTTFTSAGLAAKTRYSYRVIAFNKLGDSAYSNTAKVKTDSRALAEEEQ